MAPARFLAAFALVAAACGPAPAQVLVMMGPSDNHDGRVTFADYQILEANFGTTLAAPAPVPEPAALLLLACGAAVLLVRPYRRHSPHPAKPPAPRPQTPPPRAQK